MDFGGPESQRPARNGPYDISISPEHSREDCQILGFVIYNKNICLHNAPLSNRFANASYA